VFEERTKSALFNDDVSCSNYTRSVMSGICISGMILTGENWGRQRKSCPSAFFLYKCNSEWPGIEPCPPQ